jgi:hypothetical protein
MIKVIIIPFQRKQKYKMELEKELQTLKSRAGESE